MSGVMDGVNLRTQLAGHNRMELLTFHLGNDDQRYGINVFKVQEVIQCPPLTNIPKAHYIISGIANIRGKTIPVIDLARAIGKHSDLKPEDGFIIVTEYNKHVQGYLVSGVDRIVNLKWEEILPPPKGMGSAGYLTAVTRVDNKFVEIIDVEKILQVILKISSEISEETVDNAKHSGMDDMFVMVADDSSVARLQIKRPLQQIGIDHVTFKDGRAALDQLKQWAETEPEKLSNLAMIISDIEMPEMDGYTLTTEIRKDPDLSHLYVLLHSSLSGGFNTAIVEKVGANQFVAKYDPELLAQSVMTRVNTLKAQRQ